MDYEPIGDDARKLIERRVKRRGLPAVDWPRVVAARDWVNVPLSLTEDSGEAFMREFHRIRQQARVWGTRNDRAVQIRRDVRTRQIFVRVA